MTSIEQIKKLRQETDVSIIECKKALEQANGDIKSAKKILQKWGKKLALKKTEREAKEGIVSSYIHPNKKVGVLLELNCETDFVAKSKEFQELTHELCLQIAAMDPTEENPLLSQPWIKEESKKIEDLITDYITKLGENIVVKRFTRYQI